MTNPRERQRMNTVSRDWWEGPHDQDGWTAYCAQQMDSPIPIDDVTELEARIIQRRQEMFALLIGVRDATQHSAIRTAA